MRKQRLSGKLWAGLFAVLTPVSCALTVNYEGYEKGSSNADAGGSGGLDGCFPLSCGSPGAKCGTVSDQCGDKITCPACPEGQTCAMGECKAQADCGNGTCEAGESCATCADCKCENTICTGLSCCEPVCKGKACGPDGCGAVCAYCPNLQQCDLSGQCIGQPNCGDGTCGNGPGETCESCSDCACPAGVACLNQQCCAANCGGKECGNDGCGHSCGDCASGEVCDENGVCIPQATCGNQVCELGEDCNLCQSDCPCMQGSCTPAGTCCMPQCDDKECGADGCGSVCGICVGGACDATGKCLVCGDKVCSPGENCTNCPADCACTTGVCQGGACCSPNCAGKSCGPNGCGGVCPPGCATNFSCNASGLCTQTVGCGNGTCAGTENCANCPQDCAVPSGKLCCLDGSVKECCTSEDCIGDPSICTIGFCGPAGTCGVQFTCQPASGDCCDGLGNCTPCGGIGGFSGFPGIGGQQFQSQGWNANQGGAPPR